MLFSVDTKHRSRLIIIVFSDRDEASGVNGSKRARKRRRLQ